MEAHVPDHALVVQIVDGGPADDIPLAGDWATYFAVAKTAPSDRAVFHIL